MRKSSGVKIRKTVSLKELPQHSQQLVRDAVASGSVSVRVNVPDLYVGMNKTERAYAETLESEKRMGRIAAWRYEKVTLKLADDTRYTPDFWIVYDDGSTMFDEVKGFFRDDAKVKIKVAAEQFREFTFRLVKKVAANEWHIKVIHP